VKNVFIGHKIAKNVHFGFTCTVSTMGAGALLRRNAAEAWRWQSTPI